MLSGCSGEPTETDLANTLQNELDQVNELAKTMLGETAASQTALSIVSVSKIGCSEGSEENSYLCDVEVALNSPETGPQTLRSQLHMMQKAQGWTVIKQL